MEVVTVAYGKANESQKQLLFLQEADKEQMLCGKYFLNTNCFELFIGQELIGLCFLSYKYIDDSEEKGNYTRTIQFEINSVFIADKYITFLQ